MRTITNTHIICNVKTTWYPPGLGTACKPQAPSLGRSPLRMMDTPHSLRAKSTPT